MDERRGEACVAPAYDWLAEGGEMGARMRAFDWPRTPVGPVESWPQGLKTAVRIMLTSRYAMWMAWGPELTFFCNDSYMPTLGVKHAWALGSPAGEVWEEIWPDIGPRIEKVLRTGVATWDEALLLFLERSGYPEETYHTFSYSPLADDAGSIRGMLCVVTEETERIIGERRLRTLRDLGAQTTLAKTTGDACRLVIEALAQNTADLPFSLLYLPAPDGKTARLSAASGLTAGTIAGPEAVDLTDAASPRGWPLARVMRGGRTVRVGDLRERFGNLPGGPWSIPPRECLILPLKEASRGRISAFLVAGVNSCRVLDDDYRGFFDLVAGQAATAIANANAYEEEKKRAEALAELDRAKTAFFSNVSHEFRTPLTLMLGPAEDALARATDPEQRERLQVLHRNALRLRKLVNTLLDFSRIEAGRLRASYEPTDLAGFTAELASVFRSAVERAGMRLVVACEPVAEPVYVDRDMWEKIVLNLVSNAFKFTLEGEIEVALRRVGDSAELTVRDTGTGIAEDQLPHIFERFHRVEGARARTHEGTGIGLALVQELVKLHGGTIAARSTHGEGTSFTVTLPLGKAHLPADRLGGANAPDSTAISPGDFIDEALGWLPAGGEGADARPEAPPPVVEAPPIAARDGAAGPGTAARARVLLADDNADMREYVRKVLGERYEVVAVADGEAALAAARAERPDLVLTDVMMPRLDGFGLLKALRSDPRTAMVPVVMLSARAGEEARVEGIQSGADDYLTKPFGSRELAARVSAHLELARARREAAAADERAAAILESIADGFMALDREWRFTYVNAEAERLGRTGRDELLGKGFWDAFPGAVGTALEDEYRRAVAEQVVVKLEHPHGPWGRWFEFTAYPSREGGLSIYFRDVTARREAEEQQRLLIELNDATRNIADPEEVLWAVQGLVREHLGVSRCTYGEVHEDQQRITVLRDRTDGVSSIAGTYRMDDFGPRVVRDLEVGRTLAVPDVRADERTGAASEAFEAIQARAVLGVPLVKGGRFVALFVLHHREPRAWSAADVSLAEQVAERTWSAVEKARAAKRLYESERKFRGFAENSKDVLWITESDEDKLAYVSPSFEQVWGRPAAEIYADLGKLLEYVHEEDREGLRSGWERSASEGSSREYRIVRPDGSVAWVHDRGFPIRDEGGRLLHVAGIAEDVTERKRAEAKLLENDRRKDEFLAMLAHELRNPLAAVNNAVAVLKASADERDRSWAGEVVERQVKQLGRLIDDLLDVSRITSGKIRLREEAVDAAPILERAIESARPLIDERGHELIVSVDEGNLPLRADPTRLEQIVVNLLTNAAKYTGSGGHIWLAAKNEGEHVAISVRDDGMGIPPEKLPEMFQLFAQGERSIARSEGGLGIGLTLVRKLAEMHGGDVTATSEGPGKGSEFTVRLPAVAGTRPVEAGSVGGGAAKAAARILVVDDNFDTAGGMARLFKLSGNEVQVAHDGLTALEIARSFRPEFVLLDIGLPGMDGYQVAERMREEARLKDAVIIAVSGYGQEEDRRRSRAAGFDHHLVKPVDFDALATLVGQPA